MAKVRNGERPWAKLDDLHRENLVELLPEFEIAGLSEAEIDHLTALAVGSTAGPTRSKA